MKESVFSYHPLNVTVIPGSKLLYVSSFYCLELDEELNLTPLRVQLKDCYFGKSMYAALLPVTL